MSDEGMFPLPNNAKQKPSRRVGTQSQRSVEGTRERGWGQILGATQKPVSGSPTPATTPGALAWRTSIRGAPTTLLPDISRSHPGREGLTTICYARVVLANVRKTLEWGRSAQKGARVKQEWVTQTPAAWETRGDSSEHGASFPRLTPEEPREMLGAVVSCSVPVDCSPLANKGRLLRGWHFQSERTTSCLEGRRSDQRRSKQISSVG